MTSHRSQVTGHQWRLSGWPALLVTCGVFLVTCCGGCVHRSLTIRTDPPGALVYLNDELKGEAPVTFDFMWYGTHRVILKKDGFERIEESKRIRTPLYLWIPMDLVMELLPVPIRDDYTWAYELTPTAIPPAPVAPNVDTKKTETPNDTAG